MALLYILGFLLLAGCQALPQPQLDDAATDQAIAAFRHTLNQSVAKLWADVDYNNDSIFTLSCSSNVNLIYLPLQTDKIIDVKVILYSTLAQTVCLDDSLVTKQEFDTHFAQSGSGLSPIADELFRELDMNHDGSVSEGDLNLYYVRMDANILPRTGKTLCTEKLTTYQVPNTENGVTLSLNSNDDGQVEKQEFEAYFTKLLVILLRIQLEKVSTTVVPTTESPLLAKFKGIVDKEVKILWTLVDFNNDTQFNMADMKTIFADYDTNNDGGITMAEFKTRFSANVPSLQLVEGELFRELDMNHDDVIRRHDLELYFQMIDQN
ncbi:hypothetical protein KUTeg_022176, partial [Tegillarca granosa]